MDLVKHIDRMIEFSKKTFGPGVRTEGVCRHIEKELNEIRENPRDVTEWCDVIILALDGAWREGFTAEEIVKAIEAKQSKNENRKWPDYTLYRKGEAIEHIGDTPDGCHPKGTILRYSGGSTALMRVDTICVDHGGTGRHRYYGTHCMGGLHAAYHKDVTVASEIDLEVWRGKLT